MDVWSYRTIVCALCIISSGIAVGGVSLASQDKKVPQELTALATTCAGALIGLLVPTPRRGNE